MTDYSSEMIQGQQFSFADTKTQLGTEISQSKSASSITSTTNPTYSLLGINEELMFSFLSEIRCPSSSRIFNWVLLAFQMIMSFANLFAWVSHTQGMEGTIGSVIAEIFTTIQSFGLNFFGFQVKALVLLFVLFLQILTVIYIAVAYNMMSKGSDNFNWAKLGLKGLFWIFMIFGPSIFHLSTEFSDCFFASLFDADIEMIRFDMSVSCLATSNLLLSILGFVSFGMNLGIGALSVLVCTPSDPRQEYSVSDYILVEFLTLSNGFLALLRILPEKMFLETLTPLFSFLTSLVAIFLLFVTMPFHSRYVGAILSGLLHAKGILSFLFWIKASFLEIDSVFHIIEDDSVIRRIIIEISPAFWICCILASVFGAVIFIIYSFLLTTIFWRLMHASFTFNEQGLMCQEKENSETDEKDQKKAKKLSFLYKLAIRMQFLHASDKTRKNLAFFFISYQNRNENSKFKIPLSIQLEGFTFCVFFPQFWTENDNYHRVALQKLGTKQRRMDFLSRMMFCFRKTELEQIGSDESLRKREIFAILDKTKRTEKRIIEMFQKFWKHIKDGQINSASKLIYPLKNRMSNVRTQYCSLTTKYPANSEILRNYSNFLEEIEGNSEEADAIMSEAYLIEDRMQNIARKQKEVKITNIRPGIPNITPTKNNAVLPTSEDMESMKPEPMAEEFVAKQDISNSEFGDESSFSMIKKNTQIMSSADELKRQPSREFSKKLNTREEYLSFRLLFCLFPVATIVLMIVTLSICISVTEVQHYGGLFLKAKLAGIPYLLINLTRCRQIVNNLGFDNQPSNITLSPMSNFQANSTEKINNLCSTQYSTRFLFQNDQIFIQMKTLFIYDFKYLARKNRWNLQKTIEKSPIPRIPVEKSDYFTKPVTLFDLYKKYIIHVSAVVTEATADDWVLYFLYMWYNTETITKSVSSIVENHMIEVGNSLIQSGIQAVILILTSLSLAFCFFFAFCCLANEFFNIKRKEIAVFKRIPKEAAEKICETIAKQTKEDNPSIRASLHFPKSWIVILFLVVIFFSNSATLVYYFYAMMNILLNDDTGRRVILAAAANLEACANTNFAAGEFLKFDKMSQTLHSRPQFLRLINQHLQKQSLTYNTLKFGMQGWSTNIDNLLLNDQNPSICTASQKIACRSMENLENEYRDFANLFIAYANSVEGDNTIAPPKMVSIYTNMIEHNRAIDSKLRELMAEFSKIDEQKKNTTIWSIVTVFVSALIIGSMAIVWQQLAGILQENFTLRMMLRFLPIQEVENDPVLRNFVFSHELPASNNFFSKICNSYRIFFTICCFKKASSKKMEKNINSDNFLENELFATFHKAAILCTAQGIINKMNYRAINLLEYPSQNYAIGRSVKTIVAPHSRSKLNPILRAFVQHTQASQNFSKLPTQTTRIDCLKRSGEKFPAEISIGDCILNGRKMIACFVQDVSEEEAQESVLNQEKANSESLLLNIFPKAIATRVKNNEKNICEVVDSVACLCTDMIGFTSLSSRMTPQELITMLSCVVTEFDRITDDYDVEKIKTIGDAYICCTGLHTSKDQAVARIVHFGFDLLKVLERINNKSNGLSSYLDVLSIPNENLANFGSKDKDNKVEIRIGIHIGRLTCGVIGKKKYIFDCFGEGLRFAEMMERTGKSRKLHLSDEALSRYQKDISQNQNTMHLMQEKLHIETVEMEIDHKKVKTHFASLPNDNEIAPKDYDFDNLKQISSSNSLTTTITGNSTANLNEMSDRMLQMINPNSESTSSSNRGVSFHSKESIIYEREDASNSNTPVLAHEDAETVFSPKIHGKSKEISNI